jgi:hypothetical protein
MLRRVLLAAGPGLLLAGCATTTPVLSGPYTPGGAFQLTLTHRYLDAVRAAPLGSPHVVMLIDEIGLPDRAYFLTGLTQGETIVQTARGAAPDGYKPGSDEDQIAFLVRGLSALHHAEVTASQPRAFSFGGYPGVRVQLSAPPDRLASTGVAALVQVDRRLYAIAFLGLPNAGSRARYEHSLSAIEFNRPRQ